MNNKELLESALRSPFYRRKLETADPDDWHAIPFTTKQDLRDTDAYDLLGASLENIATYHETSGTTGKPTPSWYSFKDVEQEANVILNSELNLQPGDVVLNRFPFALAIPSFILYWACQKTKSTHIATSKASLVTPHVRVVEILLRTKATVITLLPSEAEIIAEVAHRMNISLPTPGLRALLVAGELLSPARKKYLEKLWGVPVHGFFGSTETGGLFVQCKNGHFHLDHPLVKIEVLDHQGNPAGYGIEGECAVSTGREGMPLLRYLNQDVIEVRDHSCCGCGKTEPVLMHYGRKEDQIQLPDQVISYYNLLETIYSLPVVPMLWKFHIYPDRLEFEYQLSARDQKTDTNTAIQNELEKRLKVPVQAYSSSLISEESLVSKPAYAKFAHLVRH